LSASAPPEVIGWFRGSCALHRGGPRVLRRQRRAPCSPWMPLSAATV